MQTLWDKFLVDFFKSFTNMRRSNGLSMDPGVYPGVYHIVKLLNYYFGHCIL